MASAAKSATGEGPWLASCSYWSAAQIVDASGKGTPLLPDVVTAQSDGAKLQLEPSEGRGLCGPSAWNIPKYAEHPTEISTIVATVPDPIHSHLALDFDRSIDAILLAAADTVIATRELDPAENISIDPTGKISPSSRNASLQSLAASGYDLSRVAVLSEAGTIFGRNATKPSLVELAEELIVIRYVDLIRAVLINIRYLMLFVSTSFVLALIAWNSYPFQPHAFIDWCFTILLALLTLGFVGVFAQMHRSAILSRITNTTANELGWEFYLRIVTFGAIPILTWLAYQFPEIGGSLYKIVQPAFRS